MSQNEPKQDPHRIYGQLESIKSQYAILTAEKTELSGILDALRREVIYLKESAAFCDKQLL